MTHAPVPALVQQQQTIEQAVGALARRHQQLEQDKITLARELHVAYRRFQAEGGGTRAQFLTLCRAQGWRRSTADDYLDAAHADAVGITTEGQGAWSDLVAAGTRIGAHTAAGLPLAQAVQATQVEVAQGVARIRASRSAEAAPGLVRVDLPDVARPAEERLHERLRELAASRRRDLPGGAPEVRGLLVERLEQVPGDLLDLILWPDPAHELALVERTRLDALMRELAELRVRLGAA